MSHQKCSYILCGRDVTKKLMCGNCRLAFYCGKECQVSDWETLHKDVCYRCQMSKVVMNAYAVETLGYTGDAGHDSTHLAKKYAEMRTGDDMANVGMAIQNGWGSRPNVKRALKLYEQGAALGDALSQGLAAQSLYTSAGAPISRRGEAFDLYRRSYEQGQMMGAEGLSRCYSQGVGVAMDFHLSALYLKEAAESTVHAWTQCGGKALSLYNYGVLCHKSIACQGDNDYAIAEEYMKRSAALEFDAAIKHLESTAKKSGSCTFFFNSYEGIFSAEQNPEKADIQFKAYSIFANGCHDSDGKICIERDRTRSMVFLHKAANLGHAEAKKALAAEYARLPPDSFLRGEILLASPWLEDLPMRTEEEVLAAAAQTGVDPATIWLAAVVHFRRFTTLLALQRKQVGASEISQLCFQEVASEVATFSAWSANCGRIEARAMVRHLSGSSDGHFQRVCLNWLVSPVEIVAKAEELSAAVAAAAAMGSEASASELSAAAAAAAAAASAAESTPGEVYFRAWQVLSYATEEQSNYPVEERVPQDIMRGLDFLCLSANQGHSKGKATSRGLWRGILPLADADSDSSSYMAAMRERMAKLSPWLALHASNEECAVQEAGGADAVGPA